MAADEPHDESQPIHGRVTHSHRSARIPDHIGSGVMSTGSIVMTGRHEVAIDFLLRLGEPHRVVSRVLLPISVLGQFINALESNVEAFEQNLGPLPDLPQQLEPPPPPKQHGPPTASGEPPQPPGTQTGMVSAGEPGTHLTDDGLAPERPPEPPKEPGTPFQPNIDDIYDDLRFPDEMLGGRYANAVLIRHTQAEFCFDFIMNLYPRSSVVARVMMSSQRVRPLLNSLKHSFDQFRQQAQANQRAHASSSGGANIVQRILSISGLRGVIGDGLDPEYIARFAAALGTMANGGTVVLSRDGRATGEMVKQACIAGLTATGCHVIDAGIATTPTCGVLITHLNAAAGLQITASHNPVEWNGLKPFSPHGSVFDAAAGQTLIELLEGGDIAYRSWDQLGTVETYPDPAGPHIDRVLKLVDMEAIRARKLRVVLDCNHGSGGVATPRLLELLGCEVIVLGGTPDGQFEHTPEPIKENLTELCDVVNQRDADVGFAQDPDADRLAIVDNTGRYIGEELTLALGADYVLARTPGPVVVNGSTSRVTQDIAEKYGCEFHRSYVGEAHVTAKMKEVGAILGGEGNGGVIEPKVGYVRDSFVSMAYVLAGLAAGGMRLSDWVDELPKYTIVKNKITCPREKVDAACEALQQAFPTATPQAGDGLRLDWDNRWVQVRASNTEPIIRIIAEAPDEQTANELCAEAMQVVESAVG